MQLRLGDPGRDAAAVAAIYRPAVETSVASFEEAAPGPTEMAGRMRSTLERLPWLVAEDAGTLAGYAYAAPHRQRAGYRWSVDVSVYVDPSQQGRGVGRALYDRLLDLLRRQGYRNAYAGITLPNPSSVRLHEAIGMRRIGVYARVGWKLGAWRDVAWYGMSLLDGSDTDGPPPEPRSVHEVLVTGA